MSTRCNIVLKLGETRIYIYRHHDGYLAETGADLYAKVRDSIGKEGARLSSEGAADKFLHALVSERYEKQSYESEARRVYELTSELHGDIEHAYFVDFMPRFNTGDVSIRHAARPDSWGSDDLEVDDWAAQPKRYSLESFRAAVNKDRDACNARIRELKASSKFYADAEEYAHV